MIDLSSINQVIAFASVDVDASNLFSFRAKPAIGNVSLSAGHLDPVVCAIARIFTVADL
jgi:hypothetical protein